MGAHRRFPGALLSLAAAIVVADQITKYMVVSALEPGGRIPVIEGWFQIRYITNPAGLFGTFRGLPEAWRVMLFSVIPLIASAALLVFLVRTHTAQRMLRLGLALILGGAVGNLIDRLRLGHVIDFLDVYWRQHHWPAFNVSDASICVGVGFILLDAFLSPAAAPEPRPASEEPARSLAPDGPEHP